MFSNKTTICFFIGFFIYFQNHLTLHAAPPDYSQTAASVNITSLGKVPEGFTIINESLKYSSDTKHVTYVMRNDKNQFFVRYDASTSRPYYTVFTGTPYFTPQKNRHAYSASTGKKDVFAVLDGKPGPVFDEIDNLGFSPDESHFAYRAVKGDLQCVVMDHKPQPLYDGIPIKKNLVFSPDSTHLAYVAYFKEKNQCMFVLDGKELNTYKFIEQVEFSPDSEQYAYMALITRQGRAETWRVVHNGQESELYDKIFSIVFSPDSRQFVFVALKGKQMVQVLNNKETYFEQVGVPYFSLDSKQLAYAIRMSGKWNMNINGKDGPKLDNIILFFFSPDASNFAYLATQGESQRCFINHIPDPEFDKASFFSFSPDSKRYAYAATDEKGSKVVVDGKPGRDFNSVGKPIFSPDSRYVIYDAFYKNPYSWFLVLNDHIYGNPYYATEQYVFSPDSKHVAFKALKENGKEIIVVDKNEHDIYRIVGTPFFSKNGNHIAYHAMRVEEKDEKWHLVVNGRKLPEIYGGFIRGTPIIFDSDNQFHTIALRSPGPEFLFVEVTIPQTWKITSGI
jgi:hypothetical protein